MSRALRVAAGAMLAAYPFAVWVAVSIAGGRGAGVVALVGILTAYLLRVRTRREGRPEAIGLNGIAFILLAVLALISILLDDRRFLLASPVLISAVMLVVFGMSLRQGQTPVVERFARAIEGDLSLEKAAYCRSVTQVWCVFFVANGTVCLWLATFASLGAWGFYTGGISYAIMGALFGGEFAVRRIRFG